MRMLLVRSSYALVILCLLAFGAAAQGVEQVFPIDDPAETAVASFDETPDIWFVELSSPPAVEGTSLKTLKAEKAAFRAAARKTGVVFTERYAFDTLFNGLSIRIDRTSLSKLSRIEGVKALWPVIHIAAPVDRAPSAPDLASALTMTHADIVQSELGYTGAGVRVGIIDTGLDIDHPDLGGDGTPGSTPFPTSRVIKGYDFVGNAYNSGGTTPGELTPVPDPVPDDCAGHGTHVAGIVGASGAVTGVAPGVSFGAYRVFGCVGTTDADVMIAAMEMALADGMQIINMSIGASYQWPEYPTAAAATRMVNRGIVVVCSIGNSGANGLYAASAPGVGDKVIGVASVQNLRISQKAFSISPDDTLIGFNEATAAPPSPTSGTFPVARTGTTASTNDACNAVAPPAGSLTGQIALIRRGTCGFHEKSLNAQNAGAVGVVLYNNVAGSLNPTVAGTPPITIPVVAITAADGVLIDGRITSGGVNLTWTTQTVSTPNSSAGLIASSSSWGLSADLAVKPDLSAPGANIWSTYPIELGSYANLSGTSMASPHVAGAAALVLEAKPNTPSQAMRPVLLNSASPGIWSGNPGLGFLELIHRQGAGLLQIDKSILATTRIEPPKLSLGETQAGPITRTLTITNKSAWPVTYDLTTTPALATGPGTFVLSYFNAPSTVIFGAPSILVPANGSATIDVTVIPNPGLADRSLFGGYIVFTPQGGGPVYRVPFAGFKGDYQSIQVLVPTSNNFPWLAKLVGSSYVNQPAGAAYSMAGTDIPFLLLHLDHQSRLLRFEVFDAVNGKAWQRAYQQEYVPRNSTATSFFAFPWDGLTTAGNRIYTVPNGQYVMKITVVKALGTPSDPAHVEFWTSPVITIARP